MGSDYRPMVESLVGVWGGGAGDIDPALKFWVSKLKFIYVIECTASPLHYSVVFSLSRFATY